MAKMGAPRIPMINAPEDGKIPEKVIDFNQVVYWAEMQATQEEVAASFRVSVETLNSRLVESCGLTYSELRKRVDGMAKMSLRRFQFKQAEKNATMAIWLGKNWLGQKDKTTDELESDLFEQFRNFISYYSKADKPISHSPQPEQSNLENQQPLLHQEHSWEQDPLSVKLGTEANS